MTGNAGDKIAENRTRRFSEYSKATEEAAGNAGDEVAENRTRRFSEYSKATEWPPFFYCRQAPFDSLRERIVPKAR